MFLNTGVCAKKTHGALVALRRGDLGFRFDQEARLLATPASDVVSGSQRGDAARQPGGSVASPGNIVLCCVMRAGGRKKN